MADETAAAVAAEPAAPTTENRGAAEPAAPTTEDRVAALELKVEALIAELRRNIGGLRLEE